MGLVSLAELTEGNIVKPHGAKELLYITDIGKNADGTVKNYAGYPVAETTAFISGANLIELAQTDLTVGSNINDLGIKSPAIMVGNHLRRTITADDDNFIADLRVKTNALVMQEVVSVLRQTGANEERIEQTQSPRGMDFERFTGAQVVGEARFRETPERDIKAPSTRPTAAKTISNVLDMYLEDAVAKGIIDRKTYTVLQLGRDEIVTLQDAWNAVQDGTLNDKLGLKQTFDQAFPVIDTATRPHKKTLEKREAAIAQNPVLSFMGKISLPLGALTDYGLISEQTRDIVEFSVEATNKDSFLRYDEAVANLVATDFASLQDPETEEPLTAKQVKAVKSEIAGSYNASLNWLAKDFDGSELLTARKAFFAMATSEGHKDSIIKHHDFGKPVVAKLKAEVANERAEIIANRPPSLNA